MDIKKHLRKNGIFIRICAVLIIFTMPGCTLSSNDTIKEEIRNLYGENREITSTYDEKSAAICSNGTFVGKVDDGVISFKGIPYAEQPVNTLRWKAPVETTDSHKVYEAFYFGKSPIQTEWPTEVASYYEQGEDCLYLNIWSNTNNTDSKKPVMVFIHGGSYGWGGTADPMYDGHNFVADNDEVILVTVGYRTGIMGFIDFSSVDGGEDYPESSNLGLLDQAAALKWLNKNIAAFGGDPDNVTVFGESAGGGSVSLLPLMAQTKGLFRRVIAESGSVALTYSKEECQNLTKMLLEESGAASMADLLALSEDEIKQLNESLNDYNNFPMRDGNILPSDLYAAYENGVVSDIDILIGTNADEVRYWIGEIGNELIYMLTLPVMYENNIARIADEDMIYVDAFMNMQEDTKTWNITEFYNEVLFRVPAITQALSHANNGGRTYMYHWTYPSALKNRGACHAVELAYVFNNLDETIYTGNNIHAGLAKTVQQMWVNFAKTGDPSTNSIVWPQYEPTTRTTMFLGEIISVQNDHLQKQREVIEPLLKYHFNGCYVNLSLNVPYVYKLISGAVIFAAAIAVLCIIIFKRKKKILND